MPRWDLRFITPPIAAAQARWRSRFADLYAGRPVDPPRIAGRTYGPDHGLWGTNGIDMLAAPEAWLDGVIDDLRAHADEGADEACFRPLAVELDPLGTHFIDAILGAEPRWRGGQVWADQLAADLAELRPPDLDACPVLRAALRLAALAVEAAGDRLLVGLPVFSCAANIGVNLFGERLLEALMLRLEVARGALAVINHTVVEVIRRFQAVVPPATARTSVVCNRYAPPGHGQIDGCATQVLSARHYREFFAPLDAALLACWPGGGMIHLCGAHEQHLETWSTLPGLRSIQLNDRATDGLEAYAAALPEAIIFYVSPTARMPRERIATILGDRRVVYQM